MRRGIKTMEERAKEADCKGGKHLWLVSRLEPQRRESSEHQFFKIYGRCALCAVPGASDLLTRDQLPLTEDFFTKLQPTRQKPVGSPHTTVL